MNVFIKLLQKQVMLEVNVYNIIKLIYCAIAETARANWWRSKNWEFILIYKMAEKMLKRTNFSFLSIIFIRDIISYSKCHFPLPEKTIWFIATICLWTYFFEADVFFMQEVRVFKWNPFSFFWPQTVWIFFIISNCQKNIFVAS